MKRLFVRFVKNIGQKRSNLAKRKHLYITDKKCLGIKWKKTILEKRAEFGQFPQFCQITGSFLGMYGSKQLELCKTVTKELCSIAFYFLVKILLPSMSLWRKKLENRSKVGTSEYDFCQVPHLGLQNAWKLHKINKKNLFSPHTGFWLMTNNVLVAFLQKVFWNPENFHYFDLDCQFMISCLLSMYKFPLVIFWIASILGSI